MLIPAYVRSHEGLRTPAFRTQPRSPGRRHAACPYGATRRDLDRHLMTPASSLTQKCCAAVAGPGPAMHQHVQTPAENAPHLFPPGGKPVLGPDWRPQRDITLGLAPRSRRRWSPVSRMRRSFDRVAISPPGSGWCRSRTRAAARKGLAISPSRVIAISAACSPQARSP